MTTAVLTPPAARIAEFAAMLPAASGVEGVYWADDRGVLRIFTVVERPDFDLEAPIYDAELRFMRRFPDLRCDFLVVARGDQPLEHVIPSGLNRASARP